MFLLPALLWPMTPDLFLARWWWTVILSRQTAASRGATPAAAMAALIPTEIAPVMETPPAATAAGRKAKAA